METKFTKGEWKYVGGDNASVEINIGETTCNVDRIDKNTGEYVISREEMNANAKLIAASPDLFNCLIKLTNHIQGMSNGMVILTIPIELSQKIGETIEKINK